VSGVAIGGRGEVKVVGRDAIVVGKGSLEDALSLQLGLILRLSGDGVGVLSSVVGVDGRVCFVDADVVVMVVFGDGFEFANAKLIDASCEEAFYLHVGTCAVEVPVVAAGGGGWVAYERRWLVGYGQIEAGSGGGSMGVSDRGGG
jgi:hypothetical protein